MPSRCFSATDTDSVQPAPRCLIQELIPHREAGQVLFSSKCYAVFSVASNRQKSSGMIAQCVCQVRRRTNFWFQRVFIFHWRRTLLRMVKKGQKCTLLRERPWQKLMHRQLKRITHLVQCGFHFFLFGLKSVGLFLFHWRTFPFCLPDCSNTLIPHSLASRIILKNSLNRSSGIESSCFKALAA
jgi:hypothetical protein